MVTDHYLRNGDNETTLFIVNEVDNERCIMLQLQPVTASAWYRQRYRCRSIVAHNGNELILR